MISVDNCALRDWLLRAIYRGSCAGIVVVGCTMNCEVTEEKHEKSAVRSHSVLWVADVMKGGRDPCDEREGR